jgi:hypothetical protein
MITQPEYPTGELAHPQPLSAAQRGEFFLIFFDPLCGAERVEQRSAFGVSQICARSSEQFTQIQSID